MQEKLDQNKQIDLFLMMKFGLLNTKVKIFTKFFSKSRDEKVIIFGSRAKEITVIILI